MNYLRRNIPLIIGLLLFSGTIGALAAQPRREVKAFGCYVNPGTGGDAPGYSVQLWSFNNQIIGLVEYRSNAAGRPPQGMLTEVQYDSETERISFDARLTVGIHSCSHHRKVPSHDLLSFHGFLKEDRLEGDLVLWNQLDAPPVALDRHENFVLSMDAGCHPMTFEAYEVWHWYLEPEYRSRGPQW